MKKKLSLEKLIEEENGYLITSKAVAEGFTKPYLSKYIKERRMEKVAHGMYILEDVCPDELYILQMRSRMIIYSGETALYLHGLADRESGKVSFTVPNGYNVSHINGVEKEVSYANKDLYEFGACMLPTESGNQVKTYNMERCICDLIRDWKRSEVSVIQTAIRKYMSHQNKNLKRLLFYADIFEIRDEVMKCVEFFIPEALSHIIEQQKQRCFAMRELKLDFINRIISIVSDQKTVIAYMDTELRKKDFMVFFPDKTTYDRAENVTFDFENSRICLKRPGDSADLANARANVKVIPMPSLRDERQNILKAVGWSEA